MLTSKERKEFCNRFGHPSEKINTDGVCTRCGGKAPTYKYGIAYTDNGSPPPSGKIIGWKGSETGGTLRDRMTTDNPLLWDNRNDALEACDLDGWRGYVCGYPNGERS